MQKVLIQKNNEKTLVISVLCSAQSLNVNLRPYQGCVAGNKGKNNLIRIHVGKTIILFFISF